MKRFVRYFGAAFCGVALTLFARFILSFVLPFGVSVALSYIAGHVINYLLSTLFVFHSKLQWSVFARFSLVASLGFLACVLFSLLFNFFLAYVSALQENAREFTAHLLATCVSFFANYIGHSVFSFKKKVST